MAVHHIPAGFHSVTPYLAVNGAAKLIDFARQAFGAEVVRCMMRPEGTVGHAEIRIGDTIIELAEAGGPWQPMPTALHLYVPDADAVYKKAIDAGGTSLFPPMDMFYGERSGGVKDPTGNYWYIATHTEDVPEDELARRAEAYHKKQQQG